MGVISIPVTPEWLTVDSWQLTVDSWQLTVDAWQLTLDSETIAIIAFAWFLIPDSWFLPGVTSVKSVRKSVAELTSVTSVKSVTKSVAELPSVISCTILFNPSRVKTPLSQRKSVKTDWKVEMKRFLVIIARTFALETGVAT